jgi:hypothetical protein
MARRENRPKKSGLTRHEHRAKEKTLTHAHPSNARDSSGAVVLKHGDQFLLTSRSGDVPWDLPHGFGLFFDDVRFLDGYELLLSGRPPTVLSADESEGERTIHYLTNPELKQRRGHPSIPKQTIVIERERVFRKGLHETLRIHNYGREPVKLAIRLRYRAVSRTSSSFVVSCQPPIGSTRSRRW